jgi:sugar phosphate isomerase/epimerase
MFVGGVAINADVAWIRRLQTSNPPVRQAPEQFWLRWVKGKDIWMKISFSTLGCPDWDLDTICRNGRDYGFDGVDFRGYLDTLDITTLAMFTTLVEGTRRKLANAGLEVSGISSSITVCDSDLHERNLDEARRTIALAHGLGTHIVRIFGGGKLDNSSRETLAMVGRNCVEEVLALDGARDLLWLFETHDLWIQSQDCRLLLDAIPAPFGALWDVGHTPRVGGESPQQTIAAIGSRIGYIHLKDAVYDPGHPLAMQDGWAYVLPGNGTLPLADTIGLLQQNGYDGWLQFEHEKRWHPGLPEPEIAFPAFSTWARAILAA